MTYNPILDVDSYKFSHWLQYPKGMSELNSYIEARSDKEYIEAVFLGLQTYVKKALLNPITEDMIYEADSFAEEHIGPGIFNKDGWFHILERHNGFLPLEIEAVPEGYSVPVGNVLAQVRNTDPECAWLTQYVETAILRAIWYPSTVAARAGRIKWTIKHALERTCEPETHNLDYRLHDFGARGVSSEESAALGGLGHLLFFNGSDNIPAIMAARKYYGADSTVGKTIAASEHSTVTTWGELGETNMYNHMLQTFSGVPFACVSDSYDIDRAINHIWGDALKSRVMQRMAVPAVIRLDSGEPVKSVCDALLALEDKFGRRLNSMGYAELPPYVSAVQGDGIGEESVEAILNRMEQKGFAANCINFGMGGELLQKMNRDTLGFAMKASSAVVNGVRRDVFKKPKGDAGKASKRGVLGLDITDGGPETCLKDFCIKNMLQLVYRNGELLRNHTFEEVRQNANSFL